VLDSHPELVAYPEETSFFRRYLPKARDKSLSEKLSLSDQYLTHIFEWNPANPPAHQAGFPDRDYTHIPLGDVRQSQRMLVTEQFRHDGDMLSAVILAFGQVSGKITPATHLWVEKTPYNEHYAAQIFTWWPAARIVHIVRDPRDNFASYRRKHADWSPEAFALNWARSTLAGIENLKKYDEEHYWILRYEDLVRFPEANLAHLCKFLQISDDPSLRRPARGGRQWGGNSMFADQFTAISAAPVGRWKETLKPDEISALEVVAGEGMRRMGYTLSGLCVSKPARQKLIQHLLALIHQSRHVLEQEIIRSAIAVLSDSSQLDTIKVPPVTVAKVHDGIEPHRERSHLRWPLIAIHNILKLVILWLKEKFRND
jgi:hypothetical protein